MRWAHKDLSPTILVDVTLPSPQGVENPDDYNEGDLEDVKQKRDFLCSSMQNDMDQRDKVDSRIGDAKHRVLACENKLAQARQVESDLKAELLQFQGRAAEWKRNGLAVSARLNLGYNEQTLEIKDEHPSQFCKQVCETTCLSLEMLDGACLSSTLLNGGGLVAVLCAVLSGTPPVLIKSALRFTPRIWARRRGLSRSLCLSVRCQNPHGC